MAVIELVTEEYAPKAALDAVPADRRPGAGRRDAGRGDRDRRGGRGRRPRRPRAAASRRPQAVGGRPTRPEPPRTPRPSELSRGQSRSEDGRVVPTGVVRARPSAGAGPMTSARPGPLDRAGWPRQRQARTTGAGDVRRGEVGATVAGRRAARADERAAPALGRDHAVGLELPVGAGHGVRRQPEVGRPAAGPSAAWCRPAARRSATWEAICVRSCSYGGTGEVASTRSLMADDGLSGGRCAPAAGLGG